jgi:methionyl-tRNA formyltransferase
MHTAQPSVVFFGMTGRFSAPPLRALLRAGIAVRAVVLPALTVAAPPIAPVAAPVGRAAGRPLLPLVGAPNQPNILEIARAAGIPAYEAGSIAAPETLALLRGLAPDAFCIACFNRRFPSALLALPRLGCLNVHPSLLPDNRGPDPLFWTFRRGDRETGVTIHLMDTMLDGGPIVAQQRIAAPEGIAEAALERECAELGGTLLVRALHGLADGTLTPTPQDASRATSYPLPGPDDCTITPDWPAHLANTFAAGIVGREQPVRVAVGGAALRVVAPLGYDEHGLMDAPYRLEGDVLTLRCAPGVFVARVARETGGPALP